MHLSCSPNFPRASYLDERTLTYESIVNCKLFADVLFNHNTTFLNRGEEKQPFRSNPAAFIIASRTVYARIRCEQTTAFELLKL